MDNHYSPLVDSLLDGSPYKKKISAESSAITDRKAELLHFSVGGHSWRLPSFSVCNLMEDLMKQMEQETWKAATFRRKCVLKDEELLMDRI